jgi:Glycosyl hydrolase catalytic core
VAFVVFLPLVLAGPPLRGLAFTSGDCADVLALEPAWTYNWWPAAQVCAPGIEAVPMVWGAANVGQLAGGSSPWLMGFNEPDLTSQANLTPTRAALLWRDVEELYSRYLLVSPANSHGDVLGWNGEPWLVQFRTAYWARFGRWPRLDAIALHCYSDLPTCQAAVDVALDWAQEWGTQGVWLSEFGYSDCPLWGGTAAAQRFMREMVAYCEARGVRYAWFTNRLPGNHDSYMPPGCSTVLLDYETRALTPLGWTWMGLVQP